MPKRLRKTSTPTKAIFLDRDGVINPLVYSKDMGMVDSPLSVSQFKLLPRVGRAIALLRSLGYKIFIVSNQPGVAKNKYSIEELEKINQKMLRCLKKEQGGVDGLYYCLHHPEALNRFYRKKCKCRKPQPGLITKAAKENAIDLKESFMIGDNLSDVEAGKRARCQTVFIGSLKCDHCRIIRQKRIIPDYIVSDLYKAALLIKKLSKAS